MAGVQSKTRTVLRVSLAHSTDSGCTHRNKQVGNPPLILLPRFAVFDFAALDISKSPMRYHGGKKKGIEPRERAVEASDESPA